jgi:glycosyltransferase involved in cell wall biosynthesis
MSNELVSIVTTLYNYAHFIPDLGRSILEQTYVNWEWVIVDDASTDNPLKVLQPLLKSKYGRKKVKYIQLPKNMGYSYAKNQGIRTSCGKYIVMIDADDMLTPRSIEIRKKILGLNPRKLWCHGESLVCDKNGFGRSEESRNWKRKFRKSLQAQGMNLNKQYHHRLIHAQTVIVRSELHEKYGLYDPKLRFSSDNEMWRRLIRFGEIPMHTEEFVAIYRSHPNRMARSQYKKQRVKEVKRRLIKDVERRFNEGINSNNTELW